MHRVELLSIYGAISGKTPYCVDAGPSADRDWDMEKDATQTRRTRAEFRVSAVILF